MLTTTSHRQLKAHLAHDVFCANLAAVSSPEEQHLNPPVVPQQGDMVSEPIKLMSVTTSGGHVKRSPMALAVHDGNKQDHESSLMCMFVACSDVTLTRDSWRFNCGETQMLHVQHTY